MLGLNYRDSGDDDRDLRPVLTMKLEVGGISLTTISMLVSSAPERLHFHFGTTEGRLAHLKLNLVQVISSILVESSEPICQ